MGIELFIGVLATMDILFAVSMYVVSVKTAKKDNVWIAEKAKV